MDGSSTEVVVEPSVAVTSPYLNTNGVQQTPEQLVAKAIAPVKREFLRPHPLRPCSGDGKTDVSHSKDIHSSVLKEKKSKRQLKRERRQVVSLFPPHVPWTGNRSSGGD